jgi:pimeloyl-ACP methyl ester carboxylesterase
MKYPKDTDQCIYYIFKHPFPSAQFPLEKDLEKQLQDKRILFMYGEKDWMEKIGAVRLCNKQPHRCVMFTISKYGHTFPLENPQEVADVINNNL